jgi:hypothetical protein
MTDGKRWDAAALACRITEVDPTGPVPEASAGLTLLHRELVAAVGAEQARRRFDEALRLALTPDRSRGPVPLPGLPSAA